MICIGIDPGLTGAIGILAHGRFAGVHDLPVMLTGTASKVSRMIDCAGLATLLRQILADHSGEDFAVALERTGAMPGQGVSSMYSMGDSFGSIRGVVATLGLPLHMPVPGRWKKAMAISSDKEHGRAMAISLFPAAPLNCKAHHNRAEALLLAEWLRRGIE